MFIQNHYSKCNALKLKIIIIQQWLLLYSEWSEERIRFITMCFLLFILCVNICSCSDPLILTYVFFSGKSCLVDTLYETFFHFLSSFLKREKKLLKVFKNHQNPDNTVRIEHMYFSCLKFDIFTTYSIFVITNGLTSRPSLRTNTLISYM